MVARALPDRISPVAEESETDKKSSPPPPLSYIPPYIDRERPTECSPAKASGHDVLSQGSRLFSPRAAGQRRLVFARLSRRYVLAPRGAGAAGESVLAASACVAQAMSSARANAMDESSPRKVPKMRSDQTGLRDICGPLCARVRH